MLKIKELLLARVDHLERRLDLAKQFGLDQTQKPIKHIRLHVSQTSQFVCCLLHLGKGALGLDQRLFLLLQLLAVLQLGLPQLLLHIGQGVENAAFHLVHQGGFVGLLHLLELGKAVAHLLHVLGHLVVQGLSLQIV